MMDCAQFEEFLPTYLDQTVPDEEKEEFEIHCFSCDKCGKELIRMKEFFWGMEIDAAERAKDPVRYYLDLAEYAEKKGDYEEAERYRKEAGFERDKSKIKVLVDGQEADFEIIGGKIQVLLFDKPFQAEKKVQILKNDKIYFDEQTFSSDDYLFDLAADTGEQSYLDDNVVLSESINSDGITYSVEYNPLKKKSFVLIPIT